MAYDPADHDHRWLPRIELPLTAAERDALRVMATGQSAKGAAELLGISQAAVQARLDSARRKLAAKNTTHAVAIAIRKGQL